MKKNQFCQEKSDIDTNSDLDISVKSDTSEPSALRAQMDSVTAVLDVQKLVTGCQSRQNSNTCPGVIKRTFWEYY